MHWLVAGSSLENYQTFTRVLVSYVEVTLNVPILGGFCVLKCILEFDSNL